MPAIRKQFGGKVLQVTEIPQLTHFGSIRCLCWMLSSAAGRIASNCTHNNDGLFSADSRWPLNQGVKRWNHGKTFQRTATENIFLWIEIEQLRTAVPVVWIGMMIWKLFWIDLITQEMFFSGLELVQRNDNAEQLTLTDSQYGYWVFNKTFNEIPFLTSSCP